MEISWVLGADYNDPIVKPETLKEIRDNIKKHIKNSYLKKIEAPLQDKNNNKIGPKLVAWMEIN